MRRYVMTRLAHEIPVVMVAEGASRRPLEHLVHKSDVLDWTRGTGPGAGNAPSDLARSIVGDLLELSTPPPSLYREVTFQLARIPHEGGILTEGEVRKIMKGVS